MPSRHAGPPHFEVDRPLSDPTCALQMAGVNAWRHPHDQQRNRGLSTPSVTGSTRTFLIDGGPRVRKAWSSCAALQHRVVAAGSSTRGLLWERLGSSCRARKRCLRRRCRIVRAADFSACKRRECRVDSRRSACHMPAPCYPNKARIKHIYVRTG